MDAEKEERFASQHCGLSAEAVDFLVAAITAKSLEDVMGLVTEYQAKQRAKDG
jgi:hypothetical protein